MLVLTTGAACQLPDDSVAPGATLTDALTSSDAEANPSPLSSPDAVADAEGAIAEEPVAEEASVEAVFLEDPCSDESGTGLYALYRDGSAGWNLVVMSDTTCDDALDNCLRNGGSNPASYYCEWRGKAIHGVGDGIGADERACTGFPRPSNSKDGVSFAPDSESSAACWTLQAVDGELRLLELDLASGRVSEVQRFSSPSDPRFGSSFHTAGMASLDGQLILPGFTEGDFRWLELDPDTAEASVGELADPSTMSVATDGELLFATCDAPHTICAYESYAAVQAREVAGCVRVNELLGTRLNIDGRTLYSAWHSTDVVDVFDLETGERQRSIQLEGFDDWVAGLSVVGERLMILGDSSRDGHLWVFDVNSGAQLARLPFEGSALWCQGR